MTIMLRELDGMEELTRIFPLIRLLNPHMEEAEFLKLLPEMLPLGYGCVAALEGESMVGLCGFWRRTQFWNRHSLQLDNLIVAESHRGSGLGSQLMQYIEALARREHRHMLVLDSYVHNHPSHKLYFREGYVIEGYHFTKKLGAE